MFGLVGRCGSCVSQVISMFEDQASTAAAAAASAGQDSLGYTLKEPDAAMIYAATAREDDLRLVAITCPDLASFRRGPGGASPEEGLQLSYRTRRLGSADFEIQVCFQFLQSNWREIGASNFSFPTPPLHALSVELGLWHSKPSLK